MRSTFELTAGGTRLFLARNWNFTIADTILTDLKNWDNNSTLMNIEVVEKLDGYGDYITRRHVPSVNIEISIHVPVSSRDLRNSLEFTALGSTEVVMVRRYYSGDSSQVLQRTEVMKGEITGIPTFDELGGQAKITLNVLCSNPIKTVS